MSLYCKHSYVIVTCYVQNYKSFQPHRPSVIIIDEMDKNTQQYSWKTHQRSLLVWRTTDVLVLMLKVLEGGFSVQLNCGPPVCVVKLGMGFVSS